jgi:geranylgeranyl diphosphate synthase type II
MNPEELLPLIEKEIAALNPGGKPASLYEPIRYIMRLGGKRMRPMLTCLAYSIYHDDIGKVIPHAVAVEAFHNFTLMHDDIMDQAPLRRGKPTVHEKWNMSTAILSGDVMLVKVYDMLCALPDNKLKETLRMFNTTAAEVCEGQQLDMEFETKKKVTDEEYIEMIRLKTAVLLGFSLAFGAFLADAPENERKALYDFGVNVGVGFQLRDDLLDVYADKKKFGKQVGGDIVSNKKTFLLIKALQLSGGNDRKELVKWLIARKFDKRKKVKAVTALYERLGIRALTEQKIQTFFNAGYESLYAVKNPRTDLLINFARKLAERQS